MSKTTLNPEMIDAAKTLLGKDDIINIASATTLPVSAIQSVIAGRRKGTLFTIDLIQKACKVKIDQIRLQLQNQEP